MKKLTLLLLFSFINYLGLDAAVKIKQSATAENFEKNIVAKADNRYTGTFYVATGANNGNYTIAGAAADSTVFTPLARGTANPFKDVGHFIPRNRPDNNQRISNGLFGVIGGDGITANKEIIVAMDNNAAGNANRKVHAFFENDTITFTSSTYLKDANGIAATAAGEKTTLRLATGIQRDTTAAKTPTRGKVFVRVYPAGGDGAEHSGIANLTVTLADATVANPETDGKAIKLDVKTSILGYHIDDLDKAEVEDLYWFDELQILYVGLNTVGDNSATSERRANGLVKGTLNATDGKLSLYKVANNVETINKPTSSDALNYVFACGKNNTAAWDISPTSRINKVRGMKTSTGRYYLILNGGCGSIVNADVGNLVYAVQVSDAGANKGDVVQNNAAKTELAPNWKLADLNATKVGVVALPFAGGADKFISDMEVVGDTVYVSFSNSDRDANNDPGVWSSTAMFDKDGVIVGWTRWERVFPSLQKETIAAGDVDLADKAYFFSVDAKTNQLWQVNESAATEPKVVRRTKINTVFTDDTLYAKSLQRRLNAAGQLDGGCSCVLDLPAGTPGLGSGNNTNNSFALFGGAGKVVFARTSSGGTGVAKAVTTNFTGDATGKDNYLLTTLPPDAGVVNCLGYSRNNQNATKGYFFAGTNKGLYVYAKTDATAGNQVGFNGNTGLTTLQAAPFDGASAFSWQKVAGISGEVIGIESTGGNDNFICVLTEKYDGTTGAFESKVTRILIGANAGAFTTLVIAKNSGTVNDPAVAGTGDTYSDFKIIQNPADDTYYGFVATKNMGLYVSNAAITAPAPAPAWTQIDADGMYYDLFAPKVILNTDKNSKVVGIKLPAVAADPDFYKKALLEQYFYGAAGKTDYTNADNTKVPTAVIPNILRATNIWTDGARRIYTFYDESQQPDYQTFTASLPFYAKEWGMDDEEGLTLPTTFTDIYWIENISGLGQVLAGTDSGVISLIE